MSFSKRPHHRLLTWLASWGLALEGISIAVADEGEDLYHQYAE
ncbi:MAG: hypothetical protein R3352_00545 [Salinisphaeraceae bacterium]|nr:hypothetical protein [Salinisphaeraceae bacterium]